MRQKLVEKVSQIVRMQNKRGELEVRGFLLAFSLFH